MNKNQINLNDVLSILKEQTDPMGNLILHNIGFISYDKKTSRKSSNGRFIELENVYMVGQQNAWKNQIRGFRNPFSGNITAIHIRLIKTFNSKKVLW